MQLRRITADELPRFLAADFSSFGERWDSNRPPGPFLSHEVERTLAVVEDDAIVGTGRLYSMELTVPGLATLPAAGVSAIAVLPTHRRRGALRAMMAQLLDDAVAAGEPLSILHASESAIYGRFGFAPATQSMCFEVTRRDTRFRAPAPHARTRFVDTDEALKVFPEVFDRVRRSRPGVVSRPAPWWHDEYFDFPVPGNRFDVVLERDGRPDGYLSYKFQPRWPERADGRIVVQELCAVSPEAHAALWHYLAAVDLVEVIDARFCAVDDALPWLLVSHRAASVTSVGDALWLRILDVPAALSARRYARRGGLVLEVVDEFRPDGAAAGRFALEVGGDGVLCTRTTASPDLTVGVAELGAAYLGGVRFATLAAAGLVEEHRPGSLPRADATFAADRAPFAMTWF
ncbi:MAG: GNAT family N-acetyltransferase [Acidimicrobiia bacterium]